LHDATDSLDDHQDALDDLQNVVDSHDVVGTQLHQGA
jgi:hypothetical protein